MDSQSSAVGSMLWLYISYLQNYNGTVLITTNVKAPLRVFGYFLNRVGCIAQLCKVYFYYELDGV